MGRKYVGNNLEGTILIENSLGTFQSNNLDNVLAELSGIGGGGSSTTLEWKSWICLDNIPSSSLQTFDMPTDWTDIKVVFQKDDVNERLEYDTHFTSKKSEIEAMQTFFSYGTTSNGVPIMLKNSSSEWLEARLFMSTNQITLFTDGSSSIVSVYFKTSETSP